MAVVVKNLPTNAGDARDSSLIPWSRKWHPTPVFLPGKFHGHRSLVGRGTWRATVHEVTKESDTTEHTILMT